MMICKPCVYVKEHCLSLGTTKRASQPEELMSADVCGSFKESFQKRRYLVIFKERYTEGYRYYHQTEVRCQKYFGTNAHSCQKPKSHN